MALLKISTNLWYLTKTVDRSTESLVILAALPARLVEWSVRQKVVELVIYAVWIYD